MNCPSKSIRFWSMLCCWLRPTNPHTALTPSSTAVSNTRVMKSCFVFLTPDREWRLSK